MMEECCVVYIGTMASDIRKRSRIAVVTGSSRGIGRAITLAFAKSGDYRGIVVN